MGIQKRTERATNEYETFCTITAPLVSVMAIQGDRFPGNKNHNTTTAKILQQKQQHLKQKFEIVDKNTRTG